MTSFAFGSGESAPHRQVFAIGDEVEVIDTGGGTGQHLLKEKTIITAINGEYVGERDAVQTKDFKNPSYGDWISKRMFKLIKAVKRVSFSEGDRVAIIDCPALHMWSGWERAVGKIYILNKTEARYLSGNLAIPLGDSEFGINYSSAMLEKLEPLKQEVKSG